MQSCGVGKSIYGLCRVLYRQHHGWCLKVLMQLSVVGHTCIASIREAEAELIVSWATLQ